MLLPADANYVMALRGGQIAQSTSCAPDNATNRPQAAPYQAVPRQPYQSGQSQRVDQHEEEKGVYQVDNKFSPKLDEDLSESETYYTDKLYDKL